MRKPYQKPTIVRHSIGVTNKFGRPPAAIPTNRLEGYDVRALVDQYGSPLFVVSMRELRERYRDLDRAFRTRYPKFQIAYSYKTNYLKSVCSVLHQEGAWAEVVSGFEYELARDLGVSGEHIIFNGPYKTRDELRRAFEEGARVNIDNFDELLAIEELAGQLKRKLEIGFRINMNLNDPPWVKFGFNYENGQAMEAVRRAVSGGKLEVAGMHIHAGTYIDDTSIYRRAALGLGEFYRTLNDNLGVRLKYWDLGGGFASQNTLNWAYLPGEQTCPSFDQYAEAICPALLSGSFLPGDAPRLFIEPGRALVDDPFTLLTTVVAQKRLPSGTKAIFIDSGMNILSSLQWYRYGIRTAQDVGTSLEETVVYGCLCMNIDVISVSASLPPIRTGDLLAIPRVGAYNLSQSMQFIQPRPAVIAIENGEVFVIREAEKRQDIMALDRLPERFRR